MLSNKFSLCRGGKHIPEQNVHVYAFFARSMLISIYTALPFNWGVVTKVTVTQLSETNYTNMSTTIYRLQN